MGSRYREKESSKFPYQYRNPYPDQNTDHYMDQYPMKGHDKCQDKYDEKCQWNYPVNYQDMYGDKPMEEHGKDHSCEKQKHVHELVGSVKIAEADKDAHNHRFATVTEEAIPCGPNDHIHEVVFRTDFYEDHYHEFRGRTGGAIQVGNRHVHFIESVTSMNDGHRHTFEAATLINNPIGDECRR